MHLRERLNSDVSLVVKDYLFKPAIDKDKIRSFETLIDVNKAHLLMLVSEGIISKANGQKIMNALNDIKENGVDRLKIDDNSEDLYSNIEKELINLIGMNIGGQLHTGRSRNDLFATVLRINVRDEILDICQEIITLRKLLLNLAKDNLHTVVTGYTHTQPAEPITIAHYLSAISFAIKRDFRRFINAFETANYSPLGSCAMASTSFPINRSMVARLLGFYGPVENSLDGVASRDYVLEFLSATNICLNNISRLSHDLYIWSTDEFNLVNIDGSIAASSSIMPQKKNPITLEHIKAKSAHILGSIVSTTSTMKNTAYGHSRDVGGESQKGFWDALAETKATIKLLYETLKNITFNKDLMIDRAKDNFSTMTELANTIVREANISFREAHNVVANLVNKMIESNIRVSEITPNIIEPIINKVLGKTVKIPHSKIQEAVDPIKNVEKKRVKGGPASIEVSRQLEILNKSILQDERYLSEQIETIQKKQEELNKL